MRKLVLALALALATATPARADDPPPTKDQLDAAKKAFDEAQKLYASGKYHEAISKLEDSYRLSRNAFLLYNVGHAYDQLGDKPKALAFYLKFLELTGPGAAKRDEAQKRVDELKGVEADLEAVQPLFQPTEAPKPKFYESFKHAAVDSVGPGQSVEVVARAAKEANWSITLHYRSADEEGYTSEPMTWRGDELVGRIPGAKVVGSSMHYYIEAKDADGNVVVRSGRRTSPNLMKIEGPRTVVKPGSDDPLLVVAQPHPPVRKLITPTSVSTTIAVLLIGGTVTSYLIAKQKADDLEFDSTACGQPPCQAFDSFDAPLEDSGKRFNRVYQVTLVASAAAIGVAGYFWYRSLTRPKESSRTASRARRTRWVIAPVLDDRSAGLVTTGRF